MNSIESRNKIGLFSNEEQNKLKAIAAFVKALNCESKDPGLINGRLGSFLFLFSYARNISLSEIDRDIAFSILTDCIIQIVNRQKDLLYYRNIADLGRLLIDLKRNQYVDESVDSILERLDDLSMEGIRHLISRQLFDPIVGYLPLANYLIERLNENEKAKQCVHMVIDALLESAIVKDGTCHWTSKLFDDDRIYLGWGHGLAAIMLFFSRVLSKGMRYKSNQLLQKLKESTMFLATHERCDEAHFLYPDIVGSDEKLGAFNLCYGDLGINFALYTAGLTLQDKSLIDQAVKGFYHTSERRLHKGCNVHDGSIIYGAMGICLYYKKLADDLRDQRLKDAAIYWYGHAIKMCAHEGAVAGYKRYYNTHDEALNESLLEGVAGYGLGILEYQIGEIRLLNLIGY